MFQSTYLYKVRHSIINLLWHYSCFNPRTYIRYDSDQLCRYRQRTGFNPRTYIRYDHLLSPIFTHTASFNPRTYIRYDGLFLFRHGLFRLFQSTYLYKVRLNDLVTQRPQPCFNPRTYIRYDKEAPKVFISSIEFQSTYLYKVRHKVLVRDEDDKVSIHVPI